MDKVDMIGSAEKRAIALIVEKQYDVAISEATDLQRSLVAQAEQTVYDKLKVNLIEAEITKLFEQISLLEARIKQMGFCKNSYKGDRWVVDTDYNQNSGVSEFKKTTLAGKLAKEALGKTTNLYELQKEKNVKIKQIWLATSRKEVSRLAGNGAVKVELKAVDVKQLKGGTDNA